MITDESSRPVPITSKLNAISGKREWILKDSDYDMTQEIARSAFADMLHDEQRNEFYQQALESVIVEVQRSKSGAGQCHVVDIGTGTGLLAMMAVRAGADRVTAIEAFEPMARVARKVITDNHYADRIRLIDERSTDLCAGIMADDRANVCVAEVFDTELIGEGALRTFKTAHDTLLMPNARVIPARARIWIQLIESDWLMRSFACPTLSNSLRLPAVCQSCSGSAAIYDLQLSQMPRDKFRIVCEPLIAFSFDFENGESIQYNEQVVLDAIVSDNNANRVHAIAMWWDLDMDGSGKLILSTAPEWIDANAKSGISILELKSIIYQWRDHWMQGVYCLHRPIDVHTGQTIKIWCAHDEYSLWFDVRDHINMHQSFDRPICSCMFHVVCSRNNIARMNDDSKTDIYNRILNRMAKHRRVLTINEGSMLPLMASTIADSVVAIESNSHFRRILDAYRIENKIANVQILNDIGQQLSTEQMTEIDVVISEPFFLSSILPWHHSIRWWSIVDHLKSQLGNKSIRVLPEISQLYAIPVCFDHLWKIVAPVGDVCGFNLSSFDRVILKARTLVDANVEPHSLWEYPCVATGDAPQLIAQFDHNQPIPSDPIIYTASLTLTSHGTNAIVCWMDWIFDDERIGSGLMSSIRTDEICKWDETHHQGVFFLPESLIKSANELHQIDVHCQFNPTDGDLHFNFISHIDR